MGVGVSVDMIGSMCPTTSSTALIRSQAEETDDRSSRSWCHDGELLLVFGMIYTLR